MLFTEIRLFYEYDGKDFLVVERVFTPEDFPHGIPMAGDEFLEPWVGLSRHSPAEHRIILKVQRWITNPVRPWILGLIVRTREVTPREVDMVRALLN